MTQKKTRWPLWLGIGVLVLVLIASCGSLAALVGVSSIGGGANSSINSLTASTACNYPGTANLDQSSVPVASGPISDQQVANAKIIGDTAIKLGLGGKGALLALTTAMDESTLINVHHGDDARNPNGSMNTSLGLFQQQPSEGWGTVAQVLDPAYATTSFLMGRGTNKGLVTVPGWQTRGDLSEIIHEVQGNADPTAYVDDIPYARMFARKAGIDLNAPITYGQPNGIQPGLPQAPVASTAAGVTTSLDLGVVDGAPCATGGSLILTGSTGASIQSLATNGPCPLDPLGGKGILATCNEAIAFEVKQMQAHAYWSERCLALVTQAEGGTWLGIVPAQDAGALVKRDGHMFAPPKDYKTIPRGAILWYSGGNYGHVALSIGGGYALTSDAPGSGGSIGIVPIEFFEKTWGKTFMGYSGNFR